MQAYHITSRENFEAIHRDGFIRPRAEPRKFGEQGGGFAADWHAQDNQYVFFAPGEHADFYRTLSDGSESYGFVFDAEFLIFGLEALVGPDLLTKYDSLMHECAAAVALELGPKPIDEEGLQAFLNKHQITDERMIASIRRDEGSYLQDVLDGMLDSDQSVPGAMDGLTLFKEKVIAIQKEHRKKGEDALQVLRNPELVTLQTPLEILVAGPVPVDARLHYIIAGIEE